MSNTTGDLNIFPPIPYAQVKMCKIGRRKLRTIEEVVLARFLSEGQDAELMKMCILKVNPLITRIGRKGIMFFVNNEEPLSKWHIKAKELYLSETKKKP